MYRVGVPFAWGVSRRSLTLGAFSWWPVCGRSPPTNGRRPRGPLGGGPEAAARRRPTAAGFFVFRALPWCGSCRAPRELANPSNLGVKLLRIAENGRRACLLPCPFLPDGDCSGLTLRRHREIIFLGLARVGVKMACRPGQWCRIGQGTGRANPRGRFSWFFVSVLRWGRRIFQKSPKILLFDLAKF